MAHTTLKVDGSHEVEGDADSLEVLRRMMADGTRPYHLDGLLKSQERVPVTGGDAAVDIGYADDGRTLSVYGLIPGVMIAQAWADANPQMRRHVPTTGESMRYEITIRHYGAMLHMHVDTTPQTPQTPLIVAQALLDAYEHAPHHAPTPDIHLIAPAVMAEIARSFGEFAHRRAYGEIACDRLMVGGDALQEDGSLMRGPWECQMTCDTEKSARGKNARLLRSLAG